MKKLLLVAGVAMLCGCSSKNVSHLDGLEPPVVMIAEDIAEGMPTCVLLAGDGEVVSLARSFEAYALCSTFAPGDTIIHAHNARTGEECE